MEKELFKKFVSSAEDSDLNVNEISRLSQGANIVGDISSKSDIRIDGSMTGKLFSEGRIVVGEKAEINGSVICSDLDFWGTVNGEIYVKGILSLKDTSVVNGNIHVRKLQVELGARINGTCSMISEEDFNEMKSKVVSVSVPGKKQPAPAKTKVSPEKPQTDIFAESEPKSKI